MGARRKGVECPELLVFNKKFLKELEKFINDFNFVVK